VYFLRPFLLRFERTKMLAGDPVCPAPLLSLSRKFWLKNVGRFVPDFWSFQTLRLLAWNWFKGWKGVKITLKCHYECQSGKDSIGESKNIKGTQAQACSEEPNIDRKLTNTSCIEPIYWRIFIVMCEVNILIYSSFTLANISGSRMKIFSEVNRNSMHIFILVTRFSK